MARKRNPVEAAAERIAILRKIVGRERIRAEAKPDDALNVALGITDEGLKRDEARARIAEVFDELGYLIDHLAVSHMAASFEDAARARMATMLGETRSAVEKARKGEGRWPANLVRGVESFKGLHDVVAVMALDRETMAKFRAIREVRNTFSHAPKLDAPPTITGGEALEVLSDVLSQIR